MPRPCRVEAAALALLAALALCATPLAPALAAPSPSVLGADFAAVDSDGNGLFDYLNVTVVLSPPQAGGYIVSVTLRWPTAGTEVASASSAVSLPTGTSRFTLRVEGAALNEKQLNGPFDLEVDLSSSPPGALHETASFATPPYRADDFEVSVPGERPRLDVGEAQVGLSSPQINATVNLTQPLVRWGTPPSASSPAAFEAAFPRAVAFVDGGDRAFEEGEALCAADLTRGNWSIVALEVGPSGGLGALGATVAFTLQSSVSFQGAACPGGVRSNASLMFLISERNGTAGGATPLPIVGGLEVEVGLRLAPEGPLPGSDVAFEVDLRDLAANTSYLVQGPSGFERLDPTAPRAVEALAPARPADLERVAFVDEAGAPRGHFAWLSFASLNLSGGQARFAQVTASRGVANGTLQLYLAAPSDPALTALTLDPLVGLEPPTAPPPTGGSPPQAQEEGPSATVFVAALAAVSAMFFFSVYARAKKE